jgi:hypothetical protein
MKIILLLILAALVPPLGLTQEATLLDQRLNVATDWLYRLCVVPGGDFRNLDPAKLTDAFDVWSKSTQDAAQCDPKEFKGAKPPDPSLAVDVSAIRLSPWERIARIPQFRTQIQQAPDYVYGVVQDAPANTPNQFFPNPDHALFSYGGPIHFDELYVAADTRVAICSVLNDLKQADPDHRCNDDQYLLANRIRDNFTRFGAAVSLDINYSQVPKYQAPILVTSLSALQFPSYSKTITGSFDPSKLFRSPAEMKGIAGYAGKVTLKDNGKVIFDSDTVLHSICNYQLADLANKDKTATCIQAITIGDVVKRLAISVLPRLDVKALSPFDLSKYGSSFVAPPNKAGRSLYTVTLNWDLRSIVPTTAARLDAFNAIKSLHDPKPVSDKDIKEAQWRRQVASLYLELRRTPDRAEDSAWWNRFETIVLRSN